MNKKGAFSDLFLFMILTMVILFISGIFIYLGIKVQGELHEQMDGMMFGDTNATIVIDETIGVVNQAYYSLYWISMLLIVGMMMSILVGSYMVTTRPVFFIPYFMVVIIAIVVAVGISNAYEQIIQDPLLASTFEGFVGANFVMSYLPVWITVLGFVGMIIMFSRMGSRENQLYGGYNG